MAAVPLKKEKMWVYWPGAGSSKTGSQTLLIRD